MSGSCDHGRRCWRNTFHGKAVGKYLLSDTWLSNNIACLSTYELEFLFSKGGSPQHRTHTCHVPRDRAVPSGVPSAITSRDILCFVPHPKADFDSVGGSQLLIKLTPGWFSAGSFTCSFKRYF